MADTSPIIAPQLAYFDQIYSAVSGKVDTEKDSLTEQTRAQVLLGTLQMALDTAFKVPLLSAQVASAEADTQLKTTQKNTLLDTVEDNKHIKVIDALKDVAGMALNADVAVPPNILSALFSEIETLTGVNYEGTTTP